MAKIRVLDAELVRAAYTPLRYAGFAIAAFAVAFVAAGIGGWGPAAANEQAIGEISRWCERVSGGLLREPVNALGNLAFVVAGLAMFRRIAADELDELPRTNRMIGRTPVALLYASASLFLGPGSMVMHGTHTRFGAWLDNVSMVAFILIPWLLNVSAMGRWKAQRLFGVYGTLLVAYAAGYWFRGPDLGIGLDLFGASIGIWVVSEVLYRWWSPATRVASGLVGFVVAAIFGITPAAMLAAPGDYWWMALMWIPALLATSPPPARRTYVPWFWVATGSFLVAYAIWLTGTADHPWCAPDSLYQAHAVWHILGAVATWGFFNYFRTERIEARVVARQSNSS